MTGIWCHADTHTHRWASEKPQGLLATNGFLLPMVCREVHTGSSCDSPSLETYKDEDSNTSHLPLKFLTYEKLSPGNWASFKSQPPRVLTVPASSTKKTLLQRDWLQTLFPSCPFFKSWQQPHTHLCREDSSSLSAHTTCMPFCLISLHSLHITLTLFWFFYHYFINWSFCFYCYPNWSGSI